MSIQTQVKEPKAKKAAPKAAVPVKKTDDIEKVRTYMRKCVEIKYGTLTAYAEHEGVSLQYISNVMSGVKPIPDWMYKRFKVSHVVQEHWEVPLH